MNHGTLRGVYYHEAVDPSQRRDVIEHWYERWGRPRYERTKNQTPPYTTGTESSSEKLEVAAEG